MIPVSGFKSEVMDDTRTAFERLSRQSLYYLLVANGVTGISDGMPKTRLIKIAELETDKLLKYNEAGQFQYKKVSAYKDQNGAIKIERPACTIPDDVAAEDKAPVEVKKSVGRPPASKE